MRFGVVVAALLALGGIPNPDVEVRCTATPAANGVVQVTVASVPSATRGASVDLAVVLEPAGAPKPSQDSYWAPFDLATGQPRGPNRPRSLTVTTGARRTGAVFLRAVLWARQISSFWPAQVIEKVVPPGNYRLYVEAEGTAPGQRARSNGLAVVVDMDLIRVAPEEQ